MSGSEESDDEVEAPDADTLRILLATDNHVGFLEKDPVRGEDSFRTLDEIFQIGVRNKVDMVVFGGDLFHDNKPSRRTLHKTMGIFRKHVLGDAPVPLRLLSDQSVNFKGSFSQCVNYEDPNLAVKLPAFIIHGNHDDPTREGGLEALSAVDLLSAAGLVNYFGKVDNLEEVKVYPVLLSKGSVKLALYGMGWVRDERLNRLFTTKKVQFVKAAEKPTEWFNLFAIHQNRDQKGRGVKNCVHESMIPEFMDLVMWGHEHECLIEPIESLKGAYHLTQPGSSVATSLVEGEAVEKHVGVLDVKYDADSGDTMFKLTPQPLRTVRPFLLECVELADVEDLDPDAPETEKAEMMEAYLQQRIESLIKRAQVQSNNRMGNYGGGNSGRGKKNVVPIVRLKVENTGYPALNLQRFGAPFVNRVANPSELLHFHRRRNAGARQSAAAADVSATMGSADAGDRSSESAQARIGTLVQQQLSTAAQKLQLLPENELNEAVSDFVQKEHTGAIKEFVELELEQSQKMLRKEQAVVSESDIKHSVNATQERKRKEAILRNEKAAVRASRQRRDAAGGADRMDDEDDELNSSVDSRMAEADDSVNGVDSARDDDDLRGRNAERAKSAKAKRANANGRKRRRAAAASDSDEVEYTDLSVDDDVASTVATRKAPAARSSSRRSKTNARSTMPPPKTSKGAARSRQSVPRSKRPRRSAASTRKSYAVDDDDDEFDRNASDGDDDYIDDKQIDLTQDDDDDDDDGDSFDRSGRASGSRRGRSSSRNVGRGTTSNRTKRKGAGAEPSKERDLFASDGEDKDEEESSDEGGIESSLAASITASQNLNSREHTGTRRSRRR